MRISYLIKCILLATIFLFSSCGKDNEAGISLEGTYDIIGYSLIGCEEFDVVLDTEQSPCSLIEELEFCLGGTMIFTADQLTMNLSLTVDGESDGTDLMSNYTIEGNEIKLCFTADDCETSAFKFENGVVEISSPDDDGCSSSIRARKR